MEFWVLFDPSVFDRVLRQLRFWFNAAIQIGLPIMIFIFAVVLVVITFRKFIMGL